MPDWRDKARERVKDKKAGATFKLVEGPNGFRILPNKKDLLPDGRPSPKGIQHPPYMEFRVHRDVGPDKAFLMCGKNIEGEGKCWLCDVKIPELEGTGQPKKQEQAFNIGPRESFLIQVSRVDPDTGKFSLPKPFWASNGKGIVGRPAKRPTLATQIQSAILNSRKDFIDPAKGYNMFIERSGMGPKDTTYGAPEGDDKPTKVPLAVLAAVKDFSELLPKYDGEEQQRAYFGKPRKQDEEADQSYAAEETPEETEATEEVPEETPAEEYPDETEEAPAEEVPEEYEADAETPEEYGDVPEEEPPYEEEPELEAEEPPPSPPRAVPSKKRPAPPPPPPPPTKKRATAPPPPARRPPGRR